MTRFIMHPALKSYTDILYTSCLFTFSGNITIVEQNSFQVITFLDDIVIEEEASSLMTFNDDEGGAEHANKLMT